MAKEWVVWRATVNEERDDRCRHHDCEEQQAYHSMRERALTAQENQPNAQKESGRDRRDVCLNEKWRVQERFEVPGDCVLRLVVGRSELAGGIVLCLALCAPTLLLLRRLVTLRTGRRSIPARQASRPSGRQPRSIRSALPL